MPEGLGKKQFMLYNIFSCILFKKMWANFTRSFEIKIV